MFRKMKKPLLFEAVFHAGYWGTVYCVEESLFDF
jgi:hypothetical protein